MKLRWVAALAAFATVAGVFALWALDHDRGAGSGPGGGPDDGAGAADADAAARARDRDRDRRRTPRARARGPGEIVPTGDPAFDAARALAAAGQHLEALESVADVRRKGEAAWKEPERVAELVGWEDAALDAFEAAIPGGDRAGLLPWLKRLEIAVVDPARRRRLELLRRRLVETGKLDLETILDAAGFEGRKSIERHLERFGGALPRPEEGDPAAGAPRFDPETLDAQLAAVRAREASTTVFTEPLPVDDEKTREARRLEQLEKLRQRGSEGLLSPIAASLAWLALHQDDDGSFSDESAGARCTVLGHVVPCTRDGSAGKQFRLAATALAVLAYLDFRDQDLKTLFEPTLARGVKWLRGQIRKDGSFPHAGYEAAIAMMALGQAARASGDAKVRADVERLLAFHAGKVSSDGGFRYAFGQAGDLSVTGWYVQAFEAARDAGAKIPEGFAANLERFVRSTWVGGTGSKFSYVVPPTDRPSLAGVGMLSMQVLAKDAVANEVEGWKTALVARASQRPELYSAYYEVRVELALEGRLSDARREALFELPRAFQRRDLPAAGMFAPSRQPQEPKAPKLTRWGGSMGWSFDRGGRVVTTAFAALTMEHALYRR